MSAAVEVIQPEFPGCVIINTNDEANMVKLLNLLDAANNETKKNSGTGDKILRDAIVGIEVCGIVPERAYERIRQLNIVLQK